jgi:hypothetical protein
MVVGGRSFFASIATEGIQPRVSSNAGGLLSRDDKEALDALRPVGVAAAYPINVWMVSKGLKHGMGTVRALGRGRHSVEAEHERLGGHVSVAA